MIDIKRLNTIDFGYCIIPALIAAGAAIGGSLLSMKGQSDTNKTNQKISENNNIFNREERIAAQEYNTAMLEKTWAREDALRNAANEREDTALTRQVADAKNAGLSPLSVVSSGGAGTVANVATSQASSSPMASGTVIPNVPVTANIDMSSFVAAMSSQKQLDEIARHNKATEKQARDELASQELRFNTEILAQTEQFHAKLQQDNDQFYASLYQSASQFSDELAQRELFHYDELSEREKERAFDNFQNENKQLVDTAIQFAKDSGVNYVFVPCTTMKDYLKSCNTLKGTMVSGNRYLLNDDERNPDKYIQSENISSTTSKTDGVSAGNKLLGNASVQNSTTDANSAGSTQSDRMIKQKISQMYGGVLEVPILVRSYAEFNKDYGYLNHKRGK